VITEWAIPFWIFITIVFPLVVLLWMTRERLRTKGLDRRGFEVKLTGQPVKGKQKSDDVVGDGP
jgi:hypothetical protein